MNPIKRSGLRGTRGAKQAIRGLMTSEWVNKGRLNRLEYRLLSERTGWSRASNFSNDDRQGTR